MGAPLDLLVEALEHVGALQVLMVLARQAVEGEGLLDVLLDPGDEAGVARAPFGEPGGEIARGPPRPIAAVVEPAQLLQAVVVGLARQVVEGVPEEVDVAALEGGLGQDLADGGPQAGVIVGDDELDAVQAAPPAGRAGSPSSDERLSRLAISTARIWRRPSQSMPIAISTAWLRDHAGLAHLLVARVEDQVGEGLVERAAGKGGEALVQALVDRARSPRPRRRGRTAPR